jgi:hypothetical protein
MKVKIIKFIQCGPCFINGPKFPRISLLKTLYIAIGGTLKAKVIHFLALFGLFAKCILLKCHKCITKSSTWKKYLWIKIVLE